MADYVRLDVKAFISNSLKNLDRPDLTWEELIKIYRLACIHQPLEEIKTDDFTRLLGPQNLKELQSKLRQTLKVKYELLKNLPEIESVVDEKTAQVRPADLQEAISYGEEIRAQMLDARQKNLVAFVRKLAPYWISQEINRDRQTKLMEEMIKKIEMETPASEKELAILASRVVKQVLPEASATTQTLVIESVRQPKPEPLALKARALQKTVDLAAFDNTYNRALITAIDHKQDPKELAKTVGYFFQENPNRPYSDTFIEASRTYLTTEVLRHEIRETTNLGPSLVAQAAANTLKPNGFLTKIATGVGLGDILLTPLSNELRAKAIDQALAKISPDEITRRLGATISADPLIKGVIEDLIRHGAATRNQQGTISGATSGLIGFFNDITSSVLKEPTEEALVHYLNTISMLSRTDTNHPEIQRLLKRFQGSAAPPLQPGQRSEDTKAAPESTPSSLIAGLIVMSYVYTYKPDSFSLQTDASTGKTFLTWGAQGLSNLTWEWLWRAALGKATQAGAGEGARRVGGGILGWLLARLGTAGAGAAAGSSVAPGPGTILGAIAGLMGGTIFKKLGELFTAFSEGRVGGLKSIISVFSGNTDENTLKKIRQSDQLSAIGIFLIILAAILFPVIGAIVISIDKTSTWLTAAQGGNISTTGGPAATNCDQDPTNPLCKFKACPGCKWPASGYITQGPNVTCTTDASHAAGSDANGIDIAAPGGVGVYSVTSGTVVMTHNQCGRGGLGNTCGAAGYKGYGNMVLIDSDNGYQIIYAHLDKTINPSIVVGAKVSAGDQIGWMDHSGNSSGQHLHFGVISGGSVLDLLPDAPIAKSQIMGCVGASRECSSRGKACPTTPISAK